MFTHYTTANFAIGNSKNRGWFPRAARRCCKARFVLGFEGFRVYDRPDCEYESQHIGPCQRYLSGLPQNVRSLSMVVNSLTKISTVTLISQVAPKC